ncbi:zinc finger protein 445-like [Spea bombifrons]|uniref:zinc finger protein 445-like n=1 Tax=Spea bombifrons TaxID=233779 RepID=UPI002349E4D4|nr:zinc finger protein 445-like [Spea bombifrons]
MDATLGFEVGAEIELKEGVLEGPSPLKVENTQNLSGWHDMHFLDELSSDDDLEQKPVLISGGGSENVKPYESSSTEAMIQNNERRPVNREIDMFSVSGGLPSGLHLYRAQLDGQPGLWNTPYNNVPRRQIEAYVFQNSALDQVPSNLCSGFPETNWPQDMKHLFAPNFSYYNVNTNFSGCVKPSMGSHTCSRCGRHFRRLCNLEKHLCLKRAMGFPSKNGKTLVQVTPSAKSKMEVSGQQKSHEPNNDIPEQMHVQAKKDFQAIQQYYIDRPQQVSNIQPVYTILNSEPPPVTLLRTQQFHAVSTKYEPWRIRKPCKPPNPLRFKCDKCERLFRRKYNLDIHICFYKDPKFSMLKTLGASSDPDRTTQLARSVERGQDGKQAEGCVSIRLGQRSCPRLKQGTNAHKMTAKGTLSSGSDVSTKMPMLYTLGRESAATGAIEETKDPSQMEKSQSSHTEGKSDGRRFHSCEECGRTFRLTDALIRHQNGHKKKKFFFRSKEEKNDEGSKNKTLYHLDIESSVMAKKAEVNAKVEGQLGQHTLPKGDWDGQLCDTKSKLSVRLPLSMSHAFLEHVSRRSQLSSCCRDCGAYFTRSWQLKRHQRKKSAHQGGTLKKYKCDCGRNLVGPLHFLRHQLQHLGDTAFICSVCGRTLRGYCQLRAHSWRHPLVSRFKCKCGAAFTRLPRYLWHSLANSKANRAKRLEA